MYFRWLKKVDLADNDKTLQDFQDELGTVDMPSFGGEE
jgi:hypothetical protein